MRKISLLLILALSVFAAFGCGEGTKKDDSASQPTQQGMTPDGQKVPGAGSVTPDI